MAITKEKKKELVESFAKKEGDTGSAEVQVALLTERINHLNDHFKKHSKDNHSRYGLIKLVGKRKRLLEYIKKHDEEAYLDLIKKLNIRK